MKIWDIHPGYLSQASLLEEYHDLLALVPALTSHKEGSYIEPEAWRWAGCAWAVKQRFKLVACEMALRGLKTDASVDWQSNEGKWPLAYVEQPHVQFECLRDMYEGMEGGRIVLPKHSQMLWSHHKYSVLARDPNQYKAFGKAVATQSMSFDVLAIELIEVLRQAPKEGGIRNALQHMWGHVSGVSKALGEVHDNSEVGTWSLQQLLISTQENVKKSNEPYLTHSTALSELMAWL